MNSWRDFLLSQMDLDPVKQAEKPEDNLGGLTKRTCHHGACFTLRLSHALHHDSYEHASPHVPQDSTQSDGVSAIRNK